MVRSRVQKNSFFVHFQACLLMVEEVVMLDIATYSVRLVLSCTMTCFTVFLCSLQKLTFVGGEHMFVGMFKFCLSFHTIAVRGIFHLSLYVTQLHLHFV